MLAWGSGHQTVFQPILRLRWSENGSPAAGLGHRTWVAIDGKERKAMSLRHIASDLANATMNHDGVVSFSTLSLAWMRADR